MCLYMTKLKNVTKIMIILLHNLTPVEISAFQKMRIRNYVFLYENNIIIFITDQRFMFQLLPTGLLVKKCFTA